MSITVEDSAVKRIQTLRAQQGKESLMLRIIVDGGGCSGFQYKLELSEEPTDKDIVFKDSIVTDEISLPFLKGASISFETTLIGAEFKISNPNATSGCGCGSSFSV